MARGRAAQPTDRDGDEAWARRTYAAQAIADAVDLVAIAAAGKKLPRYTRVIGISLAAGSAAVAAARAQRAA